MNNLFDIQQFQQFDNLELISKEVVEGFITGLHRSPFHGFSVEFAEHRLYNTGESTKHLDWKLFARTDRLFVKQYEEETNLRCQLVIDTSSSMLFPFEKGKGATAPAEIAKLCGKPEESDYFMPLFIENKLLMQTADGFVPATSSSTVKMESVIGLVHDATLEIPSSAPDDQLKRRTGKLFGEMSESNRKILAGLTLAEIING